MPSLFRATISLFQHHWEWHHANPGKLSQMTQKAIDQEIALDSLPDGLRDDAIESAAATFFDAFALRGDYAIQGQELARHDATEEDMAIDAEWLGIMPERLLTTLQDLFDLELECALRRKAILRKARGTNAKL